MSLTVDELKAMGTSPAAIAEHYDLSDDFFETWLGSDLVYSCALWDDDPADSLRVAQERKLDYFAAAIGAPGARVLDIGCGWGALLDRFVRHHSATGGVGLTLSPAQLQRARARQVDGVEFRLEHWADHEPSGSYDAIVCIEATEHLASDALDVDQKVAVYRAFFDRCAAWLPEGGRVGLQLICLDNVGHIGSRPGRGPMSELIRTAIFPESMPASLSELALGWDTWFRLEQFVDHSSQYVRTFRAWNAALRANRERAERLVGGEVLRRFSRYFATGEVMYRLREDALYRVILSRRPAPKQWVVQLRPSALDSPRGVADGASREAVQSHYDVANEFYETWLGPTMLYTSGWWEPGDDPTDRSTPALRKIDRFAAAVLPGPGARVLDVGCGWGAVLARLIGEHGVAGGVGLTLSRAQCSWAAAHPVEPVETRLESWEEHDRSARYDAIVSFGALEHFARDGSDGIDRVDRYRRFFERCHEWLRPEGLVGLETIIYDDAPDTASPLGRGPLGDAVLSLYPESTCPHLSEVILGFEPWFELHVLRSDADDFARTCRQWHRALRANWTAAVAAVGESTAADFKRYLAASEIQFRLRAITNGRFVLRRRDRIKR